jgi:hypothetical protein
MGKRCCRPCTGYPASKTNKKLRRARKRSISRYRIWRVYAPSVNHNYTDLSLRLRFTRTYDPYKELSYYSFEEYLTVVLLVRFNKTRPRQKHGKPSFPKGERRKPSSLAPKGERSRPRKGNPRRAC